MSSILPNQLGVALDALTISPFLVIDDKLVEVFNGDKSMWKLRNKTLSSYVAERSPKDVHISNLLLNANAHGRFYFVEILFNKRRQFIVHINR